VGAELPARDRPAQPGWRRGGHLTPLEEEIVAAAAAGELVDGGEGQFTLAEMQTWAEERTVRAAVLRHLLIAEQWPVDAKGVRLRGVRISGLLDLEAGAIRCPLVLDRCYFDADEPACLNYATALRLTLTRCHLAGLTGEMLTARALNLSRSTLSASLRLPGADITGQLSCSGAQLTGADSNGNALVADGMKVGGDMFLDGRFTAARAIRLSGADITGQLSCRGAQLTGTDSDGNALAADGMKVGGEMLLNGGFTAAGAIRLPGADITGQLSCRGAQLTGTDSDGNALAAGGMKVGGDMFLDGGFAAAGTIWLRSAYVGASVQVRPTALASENEVALYAPRARIAGTLEWVPAGPVSGQVDLEGATVGQLDDDWSSERPNGCWPTGGLRLDGFTYGRFGGKQQATVEMRLAWIRSQYQPSAGDNTVDFATQPYEQLAAVYRQAGQDTQARKAAIARRADVRTYGNLNPYRRFGNWLLDKTIKYGYQAWRAGVGLAVVFVVFAGLSFLAQHHHLMAPVGDTDGLHFVPSATKCTIDYPCFYAVGYAVDTVIPIISIHQAAYWGPYGQVPWGRAWVIGTWIATGLGWALATLLVAGYTGLVRRD
jgi:hypothetical protein